MGELEDAATAYEAAERDEDDDLRRSRVEIYPIPGHLRSAMLVETGDIDRALDATRARLGLARERGELLDIATQQLALARVLTARAAREGKPDSPEAFRELDEACDGLQREAGPTSLAQALVERASALRRARRFDEAWQDVRIAWRHARSGELKLVEIDVLLEVERLRIETRDDRLEGVGGSVEDIGRLIETARYGRRRGELSELEGEGGVEL